MKNEKNREYLEKIFKELYLIEQEAKDVYNTFLKTLKSQEAIRTITQIRDDELRHMEIAKELQKLVK